MKPIDAGSPLLLAPAFLETRFEPRGVSLVIGPFNYPITLTLGPVISALAAGNPTVIKPSELCPATAMLLERLVPMYVGLRTKTRGEATSVDFCVPYKMGRKCAKMVPVRCCVLEGGEEQAW